MPGNNIHKIKKKNLQAIKNNKSEAIVRSCHEPCCCCVDIDDGQV